MGNQSINDLQEEISILSRLLAVQNVIHIFTSLDKIADFSAASLKLVPGISKSSFCLISYDKPFGDLFEASGNLSQELSRFSEYKKIDSVQPLTGNNLRIYKLQTSNFFFGYVLLIISDQDKYDRFSAAIGNFINIVAINLENNLQNLKIKEHAQELEFKVEQRTAELVRENEQHLLSQKALRESESLIKSISNNLVSGMIFQVILQKDGFRKFTYLSDSVKQIYGISPEEGLADPLLIYNMVHKDDIDHLIQAENEAVRSLSVFKSEFRIVLASGEIKWASIVSTPRKIDESIISFDGLLSIITEQKHAEEIIKKSEAQFRMLFEKASEGIVYLSLDTEIIKINDAFAKMHGYTVDEMKDLKLQDLDIEDLTELKPKRMRQILNGEVLLFEVKHYHKDGHILTLEVSTSLLSLEDEKIIVAFHRDITDHKYFDEVLKYERTLFRTIIDNIPDPIYAKDINRKKIFSNIADVRNIGAKSEAEVINKDDFELFPKDLAEKFTAHDLEVLNSGKAKLNVEDFQLKDDGRKAWFLSSKMPLFDSNGRITGLVGVARNITERKLAEEKLQQSEERWRTIVENEPECVKVLDIEGHLLEMNPAGLNMIQATLDQVQGKKAVDLVAENDKQAFNDMLVAVFRGETCHLEFDMIGLKGRRLTLETTSVPLRETGPDGKIKALLGVTRDITERRTNEKAFRDLATTYSNLSGRKFYETVSEHLAKAMDINYVFVGSLTETKKHIKLLGGYGQGMVMGDLTYAISGTPCANVINKEMCIYPSSVQSKFPDDELLKQMEIESYVGAPVFDKDNEPLGIVVGLFTRPIENHERLVQYFNIFLDRISSEMQRGKAQQFLQESESRLSDIVFSIVDWVWEIDENGFYTYNSEQSYDILGYSSRELIGKAPIDFMPEDEALKMKALFAELISEKRVIKDLENWRIAKKGKKVLLLTNGVPFYDAEGNFKGYRGVNKDITKKKESEEALKNAFSRSMLEQAVVGEMATSPEIINADIEKLSSNITEYVSKVTGTRRASVWMFNAERDALTCIDLFDSLNELHTSGTLLKDDLYKSEFEVLKTEKYIVINDILNETSSSSFIKGYLKPLGISSILYAVIKAGNKNAGILCLEHVGRIHFWEPDEISFSCQLADQIALAIQNKERKLDEEKISMLAHAIRSTSECISITNMDDEIIFVNEAFENEYQYNYKELIGKDIRIVRSETHNDPYIEEILPETRKGGWKGELMNRRKDGSTFPIYLSTSVIHDEKGNDLALIGVSTNISKRKQEENFLKQSKRKLTRGEAVSRSGNWEYHLGQNFYILSDGARNVLGLTSEIAEKHELEKIIVPDFVPVFNSALNGLAENNQPFNIQFKIKNPVTGELVDILSIAEIDWTESIIFGVFKDITILKKTEDALRRQTKNLEYLLEVSNAFTSTLEYNKLLQLIVDKAVRMLDLDIGAFYLLKGDDLYLSATTPSLPIDLPEFYRFTKLKNHLHILKSIQTGELIEVGDTSLETWTPEEQEIISDKNLLSVIYVPMKVENHVFGILILGSNSQARIFRDYEIDLYRTLSAQAALVLENAELFEEKQKYTTDLETRNKDLYFLSNLAFELAVMPSSRKLRDFFIEKIKDYTGSIMVASSDFDPVSRKLSMIRISGKKKLLNKFIKKFGRGLIRTEVAISEPTRRRMISEIVNTSNSLSVLTYGSIPESVDKAISKLFSISQYCEISITLGNELLGTIFMAFQEGQQIPQKGLLLSVGHLAAISLRRNQAENELLISKMKLESMIGNISDVITIINREGKITYDSPTLTKVLGWDTDELIGRNGFDFVHPDDLGVMKNAFKEIARKKEGFIISECRYLCKDGSYKWVRNAGLNMFDNPAINGILLNYHDITQRKKSEETLIKFKLGIERSPEAVFMTDTEGRFTYINNAFSEIYGYDSKEILGLTPRVINSGKYTPGMYKSFWNTLLSKNSVEGEIVNRRKDGTLITIEGSNNPIVDADNKIIGYLGIHHNITQKKEREEALKFSEERFRKAFHISPDAMAINRLTDGMYVSINNGFETLTGYKESDIIGKTSYEINIWADSNQREKMAEILRKRGRVHNFETKFRLKDGNLKTGLMSASIIEFEGVPHILSITRDIEEIKKTQDALAESEIRFKQVAENAEEWIWEVDSKGLYTYSSQAVKKLLGYKPEELVGKYHFYDLFAPDTRDKLKKECLAVFKNKERFQKYQNRNIRKDGKIVVLETSGTPVLSNKGKLLGYRGTDSDITQRLKFIEELHKLSVAVEQSPASIVITNLAGEIEYVNPRFCQMTGYSTKEALGENPHILKSGNTSQDVYEDLWNKITNGKEWKGEFLNKKKNGELFWEAASISPIIDDEGRITHYIAVKEDITEKKEATRKNFDTIIETEERERRRYSHELHDGLGPILSTIRLYFQLLAENTDNAQKDVIIEKTGNCISQAIQTIKEISYNLSPNVLTNFGIISGLRNFINLVNETGKLKIEFETNTQNRFEKNVEVAIYRIITELINNTVKYSGASMARIVFNLNLKLSTLCIEYSDNGCGFDLEKVTEKGRGLGLSNIYQRVSTLNGKIKIETSPGNGIKVQIELIILFEGR